MSEIDSSLDHAIKFFTSSLSIDNSDTKGKGGFYGFQNSSPPLRKTDRPFIFYEITGYGINLLLKLYSWFKDPKFLKLANEAAECILKAQIKSKDSKINGAIYDRYYPDSDEFFESFHSYPNGVCAGALCELYKQTKNKKFRDSAKAITEWLFQILIKKNNSCIGFKEFYDPNQDSQKIFPYESICIPFILLKFQNELELSNKQKTDLIHAVEWGTKSQTSEGFFPFFYSNSKNQFNNTAYTHFAVYPLYNLMGFPLSELDDLGCKDCFRNFVKCGEWLTSVQGENGGFYTYYFQNGHVWHQQSPAVGQALCAFVHLYQKTKEKKFFESAKKCVNWLVDNQIKQDKFQGSYYWISPNKHFSNIQKKIMYAKERFSNKFEKLDKVENVTGLLDKIPIWPVQFAIEGLYRFSKIK